jgi:Uma2 family endonuclease
MMEGIQPELMATVTPLLTLEEFHSRYQQQKPYFEYWFGEPIQKTMPTWLHSVLQGIMRDALLRAGYKSGLEVELRIDPQWQPIPDVIGTRKAIKDYPTEPVEIVVEILSPDDKMMYVLKKCHHYERIGIERIFVLDPVGRFAWQWNSGSLESVAQLLLPNGAAIVLDEIWRELEEQA